MMTAVFRASRPQPPPGATSDPPVGPSRWDEAVARMPDGNVYQTSGWARGKGPRFEPRVVTLPDEGGGIRAGAQLLIRTFGPFTRAAYVPYGPLFSDIDTGCRRDRHHMIDLVEDTARAARCGVVLIQPSRRDHTTARVLESRGYRRAPVEVATTATLEVELGRPDEELLADMSKSRRRNVRRAERRGVVVDQGSRSDLAQLARLCRLSAERHGFLPMSLDYLYRQWDALHPAGHLHLFLARLDDCVVAAGTAQAFGRWAEFKLTGWDASAEAGSAFVNEAVHWAMMSWVNQSGHQALDLGGLPRNRAVQMRERGNDEVLRGTGSEFKLGWGGQVRIYPATYQKVQGPMGHLTYSLPSRLLDDHGLGGRLVNWVRRS